MLQMDETSAFEARKLDPEVAARMGAQYRAGQFQFEFQDHGVYKFRKFRTSDKQFWIDPPGQKLFLWNLDALRGLPSPTDGPLVITEGEFDAIAVVQACGGYVVSVPNGADKKRTEVAQIEIEKDKRFAFLWGEDGRVIPEVMQFDRVILAVDNDEAGTILRDELAMRIGLARCWFVEWPEGCKDANDVLMKHDEATLRRAIAGAQPIQPGHLIRPSEAPPRKSQTTYSTGWDALDPHLMLVRPELIIVTGIPGHGKSQWVRSLAFHLAKSHGLRTAFLTPEDPPYRLKRDMKRFAEAGDRRHYSEREISSKAFMDGYFMISNPPEDDTISLETVQAEMESAALHYNCQVFVVDPWNEIAHQRGRQPDTEYIEHSLMMLKRKAFRLNMMLIIIAHPTKLEDGKKPTLYNISGSANWKNKCDHGIIIHRVSEETSQVEVIVEKSKDHETMGRPGAVWMEFDRASADYQPIT